MTEKCCNCGKLNKDCDCPVSSIAEVGEPDLLTASEISDIRRGVELPEEEGYVYMVVFADKVGEAVAKAQLAKAREEFIGLLPKIPNRFSHNQTCFDCVEDIKRRSRVQKSRQDLDREKIAEGIDDMMHDPPCAEGKCGYYDVHYCFKPKGQEVYCPMSDQIIALFDEKEIG